MPDQKDRLGEKLRKKEKAEEDRYFAEQDRLRLERLKNAGGVQPALGLCPRCGIGLRAKEHNDVQIDECSKCGGIWLDQGELELLVEREDENWASRWFRSVLKK